jgi:hypothetical protein
VHHGYEELGDSGGCGLGRTTASVLSHRRYLEDPHKVQIIHSRGLNAVLAFAFPTGLKSHQSSH